MKPKNETTVTSFSPNARSWISRAATLLLAAVGINICSGTSGGETANGATAIPITLYKMTKVNGLDIFYREAGPTNAPTIILLHGLLQFRQVTKYSMSKQQ